MQEFLPELWVSFSEITALQAEFEKNLRKARIFVLGAEGVPARSRCILLLEHPNGAIFRIEAESVYVKPDEPGKGIGFSFSPFDATLCGQLQQWVEGQGKATIANHTTTEEEPQELEEPRSDEELGGLEELGELEELEGLEEPEELEELDEGPQRERTVSAIQGLRERIQYLTVAEQQRIAGRGGLQERLLLERTYGPTVWDALLSNPRVTPPEIARIARKGSAPRPTIEAIATNNGWLTSPEVQRALLGNPRTGTHLIPRLLRSLSRADLMLVPTQSAYPAAVRSAAKKMLQGK